MASKGPSSGCRQRRVAHRKRSTSSRTPFSSFFFHFPCLVREMIQHLSASSPNSSLCITPMSSSGCSESNICGQFSSSPNDGSVSDEDQPSCCIASGKAKKFFRHDCSDGALCQCDKSRDSSLPSPKSSGTFSHYSFQLYLTPNAHEALQSYVYKGEDCSYLYKYIWHPLCRRSVRKIPTFLSANAITLGALAQGMIPLTLYLVHSHFHLFYFFVSRLSMFFFSAKGWSWLPYSWPTAVLRENFTSTSSSGSANSDVVNDSQYPSILSPPFNASQTPSFVFLLNVFALLLYQYLDNLDGHQARNLNMSSPLGLWLDHGCDAFHSVVMGICVCSYLSLGASWKTLLVLCSSLSTFFMNTWEEYHLGEFILPVINGPNEGLLILCTMYVWTAIKGSAWWTEECELLHYDTRLPQSFYPNAILSSLLCPLLYKCGLGTAVSGWTSRDANDAGNHPTVDAIAVICCRNTLFVFFLLFSTFFTCAGNWYNVMIHPLRKRYCWRKIWLTCCKDGKQQMLHAMDASPFRRRFASHESNGLTDDSDSKERNETQDAENMREVVIQKEEKINQRDTWRTLLPMLLLSFTVYATAYCTDAFFRHPYLFVVTIGLLYTYITTSLMLAHMCDVQLHQCPSTLWWYFMVTVVFLVSMISCMFSCKEKEKWILHRGHLPLSVVVALFIFVVFSFVHFYVTSVVEMANALQIRSIFHVPYEKKCAAKHRNKRRHYLERMKYHQKMCDKEGTVGEAVSPSECSEKRIKKKKV